MLIRTIIITRKILYRKREGLKIDIISFKTIFIGEIL